MAVVKVPWIAHLVTPRSTGGCREGSRAGKGVSRAGRGDSKSEVKFSRE